MRNHLFWICILFILNCSSCVENQSVKQSLLLAGENAGELEKVLSHYKRTDKEKYKAACYLIENMKYHKSSETIIWNDLYTEFFSELDSIAETFPENINIRQILSTDTKETDSLRNQIARKYAELPPLKTEKSLPDLQIITAEFLIEHIDLSFSIRENSSLLKNMSFDEFKELILPYRVTDEPLIVSRQQIRDIFYEKLGKDGFSDVRLPIEHYKRHIAKNRWLTHFMTADQHIGMHDVLLPKFTMDCHNMINWSVNILRSVGIPVYREYTPQWREKPSRHFWCVTADSAGIYQPYTAPENNLREDYLSDIKNAGKVYRKTFAANKNTPYFLATSNEHIPPELTSPLLQDETFRYHQTVTFRFPLTEQTDNALAYLGLFRNGEVNPVAWGKIDKKKREIIFEQVPLNTVFIPVLFQENKIVQLSAPFILQTDGLIDYIEKPLTVNKQHTIQDIRLVQEKLYNSKNKKEINDIRFRLITPSGPEIARMHLLRKHPEKNRMQEQQAILSGALFTGCNELNGVKDTLAIINKIPIPNLQEMPLNNHKKYRYYQFTVTKAFTVNIAHMEFLGGHSSLHTCIAPTPLPVFYEGQIVPDVPSLVRIQGEPLKTSSVYLDSFDNNFDTYVGFHGTNYIGMDFKYPVHISHVRFAPRTANNMVVVGDTYELFYYDYGWKSHSKQKAKYNYLIFENVPDNTLYWLRNLDHGKEELPFFYIEDRQYFMNYTDIPFEQPAYITQ